MPADAAEIVRLADGLTDAQRHIVSELKPGWKHRPTFFSGSAASRLSQPTKDRPALVFRELTMGGRIAWYGLTEDGAAVREHLRARAAQHDHEVG